MIKFDRMSGGAFVWLVFFVAILGESWITERYEMGYKSGDLADWNEDVKGQIVTEFEINEAGLPAVLADAVADAWAVHGHLIGTAEAWANNAARKAEEGNLSMAGFYRRGAQTRRLKAVRARQVAELLAHLERKERANYADVSARPSDDGVSGGVA